MPPFDLPRTTELARFFDPGSFQRGRGLIWDVRINAVTDGETSRRVSGVVHGTQEYGTTVTFRRTQGRLSVSTDCTCPVGGQCKHGVAMALRHLSEQEPVGGELSDSEEAGTVMDLMASLRGAAGTLPAGRMPPRPFGAPVPQPWSAWFEDLAAELGSPQAAEVSRLALRVEVSRGRATRWNPRPPAVPVLTPLKQGKRGWIKTGASWSDLAAPWRSADFDQDQRAALAQLGEALQISRAEPAGPLELQRAAPGIWSALAAAVASGVEFVAEGLASAVIVAEQPLDVEVDLLPEENGDIEARLGVGWEGSLVVAPDLMPVGRSAHGVVLLPSPATAGAVVLAPLRRRLAERLSVLLSHGSGATVPGDERERLVRELLPRLAAALPVRSSDESLRPTPPDPPTLVAHVRWAGTEEAVLRFAFRYRSGSRVADVSLRRGAGDGAVVRQVEAERELLAGWEAGPVATRMLETDGGPPQDAVGFAGERLVRLRTELLPELREQLEVVEAGPAPELYRLEGDPEIDFVAVDAGGAEGSIDWLDLRVSVTVDGEEIPLPDLLAALGSGVPLVLLPSGAWVSTEHPALARLARLVTDAATLAADADRLRVAAGDAATWSEAEELGAVPEAAARWVAAARAVTDVESLERVEPVGVGTELREYQRDGLDWLVALYRHGLGGILADDMGLGKTLQTLALISTVRAAGDAPFLVVAPTSVVSAWEHQAGLHTPGLRIAAMSATTRKARAPLAERVAGADVVVTSYTLLRHDAAEYAALTWSGLVLDEAQAIKNAASKTFRAARAITAPFALAVTGTPFENRLAEIWPLLAVVAPGLYPRLEDFKAAVATPVERDGDQEALARLRRRLRPFMLRRTKELVAADLPEKQEEVLPVELTPAHRRFYDTLLQRERRAVLGLAEDMDRNRVAIFASLTRLRRAALHTSLVQGGPEGVASAKVTEVVERLVELAAEGHRALVFSQFTSFLTLIRDELEAAGMQTVYLDGSTRDRGAVMKRFREGAAPVFLISLKAGGTGLTLTAADYVFVMDPWWNPAVEAQAVDRAHRIGQTRNVMVYRLVAEGTIEEKVMALKDRKAALFDQVIGDADATPHALDAADVRELFG